MTPEDELREKIHSIVGAINISTVDQGYGGVSFLKSVIVGKRKAEMDFERLITQQRKEARREVLDRLKQAWGSDEALKHFTVTIGEEMLLSAIEAERKKYE